MRLYPSKKTSVFLKHYDKSGWKKVRLGTVCKVIRGSSLQSKDFVYGKIPVVAGGIGCAGYHNQSNRGANTITISASGANAGYINFYKEPIFATDCSTISESKDINIKYIYFALKHKQSIVYKSQTGGAQPHVHPKDIENIDVYLPQKHIQTHVADMLEQVDYYIRDLEALISKQESIKKTTEFLLLQPRNSWRTIRVSECLDYEQPGKYIIHTDIIPMLRNIPVLTANKSFIIGYTEESDNIYDKGAVIIYDDFTMDMKYVTFAFKVKSSAIKLLTAKPGYDLYFIYSLLKQLNLAQQEHARSYISKVECMYIKIPDLDEQKQIAEQLKKLDQQLEHLRSELDKYRNIKKGLMDYFFG